MALRDLWRGGPREREHEARYGAHGDRERDEEQHRYDERWQNSSWENANSGPGASRVGPTRDDRSYNQNRGGQNRGGESHYGGSTNPFYGDHPLMRAGSEYDYNYFGSKAGLPTTQWRGETSNADFDDLVYGGRSPDADAGGGQQARGEHRGRGPRGYRRTDERIKEDVCQCLTDDQHIDATNIDVAVSESEVTLSGSVSSRMQKRHAEDLIERLPGVRDVINGLRVVSDAQSTQSSSSLSTSQATRPGTSYR